MFTPRSRSQAMLDVLQKSAQTRQIPRQHEESSRRATLRRVSLECSTSVQSRQGRQCLSSQGSIAHVCFDILMRSLAL